MTTWEPWVDYSNVVGMKNSDVRVVWGVVPPILLCDRVGLVPKMQVGRRSQLSVLQLATFCPTSLDYCRPHPVFLIQTVPVHCRSLALTPQICLQWSAPACPLPSGFLFSTPCSRIGRVRHCTTNLQKIEVNCFANSPRLQAHWF